ncbi:hypothetical protein LPB248_10560 [Flavobacterium sp. LPB0248]|uniref:hypothetical protein n=1 Tax=Flavobacterium sp. LPB0248 TaxID=2614441 RepID=UPI0015A726E5|nr:hypothetical protein [Flavobacterium sp. LPB0248]QLC66713.1 hypothetical protein LPB248_10560 [Flavobacterium sp. LPB0248]
MENINIYKDVQLTENYQGSSYKNNLNDHIVSVLDYASMHNESKALKSKDLKFSKQLYWECLDVIYEKNYIKESEIQKSKNRKLKQNIYKSIIESLGDFFKMEDNLLVETIDFTVSNYMDNYKYQNVLVANNPFSFANNIFINNKLLYSFTDNKDEYSHLLKPNKKESELSKNLTIGVLGKGHRKDYSQAYIKDIYALRNLLINLLDEKKHDCRNPIKISDLNKNFRDLGIPESELTDSNIKNWIVQPLKRFTKIGSNKYGYFIIKTEEDLFESYESHYKKFLGLYKTLERHKYFAKSFNEYQKYTKHLSITKNDIFEID